MRLDALETNPGENIYYDPGFYQVIYGESIHLKTLGNTQRLSITPATAYKFEGDFYGLLNELRVPKKYHLPLLQLNGLRSSNDFSAETLEVFVPDLSELDLIKATYLSRVF